MDKTGLDTCISCSEYRPRVLIAQSDTESLSELVKYCKAYNKFDVITATTGQEIIDAVNGCCFDALVLGLKFPDITGATLAYLVHQFDPLVSVAFLSSYDNDILVAGAKDLGFEFWNKTEKFKDLGKLCTEIYDLAITMPCDDSTRIIKREYMKPVRDEYLRYEKLRLPNSLMQVLEERKQKQELTYGR